MKIRNGWILECSFCRKIGPLKEDLSMEENETVQIKCSYCQRISTIGDRPLPKLPPDAKRETSFNSIELAAEQEVSKRRSEIENELQDAGGEPVQQSFMQRTEKLADNLATGLQMIEDMKYSLDELARSMVIEFEETWSQHDLIRKWDMGFLNEFVERPFMQFPVETDDPAIKDYCCYIIAPKFFEPRFGIPLPCTGGFRLELMTPYTRFSGFNVSQWLADYLELPSPLELEVYGNKIIGKSLHKCWASIPGVEVDEDHTDDHPSVRIKDQILARQWLARNGVTPWQPKLLSTGKNFAKGGLLREGKATPWQRRHWRRIRRNGRVLLSWYKIENALAMSLKASTMIHGFKLFISDEDGIELWKKAGIDNRDKGCMWHTYEQVDPGSFDQVPIIFLYYSQGNIPMDYIEQLYHYKGSLLIVTDDPVSDVLCENDEAATLSSLVADIIIDLPRRGPSWRRQPPERNRVVESLRKLQQRVEK